MAIETVMRMVTENRQGQRCFSYLIFRISKGVRERKVIPFSAGNLFEREWLGVSSEKGIVVLLYKLNIYKWMREEGGRP